MVRSVDADDGEEEEGEGESESELGRYEFGGKYESDGDGKLIAAKSSR